MNGESTGLGRGEGKRGDSVVRQRLGAPVVILVVTVELVDHPHPEHEVLLSRSCSIPQTVAVQTLVGLQRQLGPLLAGFAGFAGAIGMALRDDTYRLKLVALGVLGERLKTFDRPDAEVVAWVFVIGVAVQKTSFLRVGMPRSTSAPLWGRRSTWASLSLGEPVEVGRAGPWTCPHRPASGSRSRRPWRPRPARYAAAPDTRAPVRRRPGRRCTPVGGRRTANVPPVSWSCSAASCRRGSAGRSRPAGCSRSSCLPRPNPG